MGNCLDKEDSKKKSTAEIAPSDCIRSRSVGIDVDVDGGGEFTPPVSRKVSSTGVGSGGGAIVFSIKTCSAGTGCDCGGEFTTPVSSKVSSTSVESGGEAVMFSINSRSAGTGSDGGGIAPVVLYGHQTSCGGGAGCDCGGEFTPPVSSSVSSTSVGSGGEAVMFSINCSGAGTGYDGGGKAPVMLYGHPTSCGAGAGCDRGGEFTPPVSSSKVSSTSVGSGVEAVMFSIKSRGAGTSYDGGGEAPVMLYGHPTSLLTYYLRFALLKKPVALEFAPSIFEMSLFTLEFGKGDVVSGSAETVLQMMDARFPEPPLLVRNLKQGRDWNETTPFLVKMSELQHRSMKWHLERLVRWAADLAARGGKAAIDPAVGTPKMEVKKFGKSYGQLYDVLLEHAQMEEKVVFPILQREDRALCKSANEEHARDLPIMNGIKEAIKSIVVLDAGTPDHREALHNMSSRLVVLQDNCREHFVEEERNVLPLLEAVELSKEQQKTTLSGCITEMHGTHSHLFRFFMEGLQPHEAVQYMDLIIYSMDKDKAAAMLCRLVE